MTIVYEFSNFKYNIEDNRWNIQMIIEFNKKKWFVLRKEQLGIKYNISSKSNREYKEI